MNSRSYKPLRWKPMEYSKLGYNKFSFFYKASASASCKRLLTILCRFVVPYPVIKSNSKLKFPYGLLLKEIIWGKLIYTTTPPLLLINEISLLSVKINSQQKQARERPSHALHGLGEIMWFWYLCLWKVEIIASP